MRKVRISDITLAQTAGSADYSLSFKDRIDLAVLVDRLQVDVIEIEGITERKADSLRVKSIAGAVKNAVVAVPVSLSEENAAAAAAALKMAGKSRLQVKVPVSPVQMEYLLHLKPAAVKEQAEKMIRLCRTFTDDVEFAAMDATRSDRTFLYEMLSMAAEAGAGTITVCDAAGSMLPDEFEEFIKDLYKNVPALSEKVLGVSCSDELSMAAACAMEAVGAGAGEIKAAAHPVDCPSLKDIGRILNTKGEMLGVSCGMRLVELKRVTEKASAICDAVKSHTTPFDDGVKDDTYRMHAAAELTADSDKTAVARALSDLGYELADEDLTAVWEAFKALSAKKEKIGPKELDAIVASRAMQVPSTYELDTYMINIGNQITCMAHIRLKKNGVLCEGMALGDGPIDAAFLALEQITGHHYVLDDFQIRAVTEGHEAMGETIVKLQSGGRIYAGRGISTDIVGSGVLAYINALNKITYEEAGA